MGELCGAVDVGFVDQDGDFDLGGVDQLDVDSAPAEAIEQASGDAGMRAHPDSHDAELGQAALGSQTGRADFCYDGPK